MIRVLGVIIVMAGIGLAVADLVISLGSGQGVQLHALGWWWAAIDRDSLLLLQPAVERHLSPALWDPGIQTLLEWPAAPQLMVLGAALWGIGRLLRRKPAPAAD
ncbi:MAG: hypothetical protein AAGD47_12980 [Pseudomonadota bacterium]